MQVQEYQAREKALTATIAKLTVQLEEAERKQPEISIEKLES